MLYRVIHNKNYTIINNTIFTDKRLSWKAKGIWTYAFSRPDDWSFNISDLMNQSTDGRDSVRSGLKELEESGYLKRYQHRQENGSYGDAEWTFFEIPQLKESLPETENQSTESQKSENRPLLSTDNILSTEAASKQPAAFAAAAAAACLDNLPFTAEEKKNFASSFNAEQCKHAISFYNAKISLSQDFTPTEGWFRFLCAAIHKKWPIPEKPVITSKHSKTLVDSESNKEKAKKMFLDVSEKIDHTCELLSLFSDKIEYRHRKKDLTMPVYFNDLNFDEKLNSLRKIIVSKR